MAFSPQFLDELRQRVSLAGLVGRRVRLIKRGREYTGLCPFHNEKSPSFTVSEEKAFFHCFGCGAHGDAIGFVMRCESLSFPEAVEKLAGEAGLEVPRATPEEAQRFKAQASLRDVTEGACQWFEARLRAPEGRAAFDYLRRRGLDDATIARFRLGYAPESAEGLKRALAAKNITEEQMVEAGLLKRPDDGRPPFAFFRDRVIFPIADRGGRIVAFGARTLGDGQPKYLNSPDTPLFDKGRSLYAVSLARVAAADKHEIVVCEGYMDVIAMHRFGFANTVAPLGTALTESQLDMLWKIADEPTLCFDADAAGQRAAARAALRALPLVGPGRSVRFAELSAGKDPDDLLRDKGAPAMREVLDKAIPLVELVWRLETTGRPIDTPERRAALRRSLEGRAQVIADRQVQDAYRAEFRKRLDGLFGEGRSAPRQQYGRQQYAARPWSGQGGTYGRKSGRDYRFGPPPIPPGFGDSSRRMPMDATAMRWRILLAGLLNHPILIDELGEWLMHIPAAGEDIDNFVQELHTASRFGLDSTELRRHLTERGLESLLHRILTDEVYALAAGVRPQQDLETARKTCISAIEALEAAAIEDQYQRLKIAIDASPQDEELARQFGEVGAILREMRARIHALNDGEVDDAATPRRA